MSRLLLLFVIVLWTRGGSNFADGIDITLLRIIKISFCYINITFVCQAFYSFATWVFTDTAVMSYIRHRPVTLILLVFSFSQEWVNNKFIWRQTFFKYFIWQCEIISVNIIRPPFLIFIGFKMLNDKIKVGHWNLNINLHRLLPCVRNCYVNMYSFQCPT